MLYLEYVYYLIASVVAAFAIPLLLKREWGPSERLAFVTVGSILLLIVDWGLYLTTGDRLLESAVKGIGCRINPKFKACQGVSEKLAAVTVPPTIAPTPVPETPSKQVPRPAEPTPTVNLAPQPLTNFRPIPAPESASASRVPQGPIPEDIIGIHTGVPCRDALDLITREYPDLEKPLKTGRTRYNIEIGGGRNEVLADTIDVRDGKTTVKLTCMPTGGQSVVVFVGRMLVFEQAGRYLADIERFLTDKYGALPHRMNVAAVNPFNMVRMGRVYGPDGVLPPGSNACGDFQATGGWTVLGMFGGENLHPLRLGTCVGGLFIRGSRSSTGQVTSLNIEVWDFRLVGRAAEEAARQKSEEISAKSKLRLPL